MGLVVACEHDGVYRGISVCSDHLFKQRCVSSHHRSHGIIYEQPPVLLWADLCGGLSKDGKTLSLYGAYYDR